MADPADARIQFRRGNEADRASYTPASGEPVWTEDEKKLYIGDGTTAGGVAVGGGGGGGDYTSSTTSPTAIGLSTGFAYLNTTTTGIGHTVFGGTGTPLSGGMTAFGSQACYLVGNGCTGFGYRAAAHLFGATPTPVNITGVGSQACYSAGSNSTGVGVQSAYGAGEGAVGIGYAAARLAGEGAVGIGYRAAYSAQGQGITAVGYSASYGPNGNTSNRTTSGARQTLIGCETGQSSSTQVNDITCLGYRAIAGGTGSTALGSTAQATHTGATAIGYGSTTQRSDSTCIGARDLEITDATKGIILKSPDGNLWRVTVDNTGTLTTAAV